MATCPTALDFNVHLRRVASLDDGVEIAEPVKLAKILEFLDKVEGTSKGIVEREHAYISIGRTVDGDVDSELNHILVVRSTQRLHFRLFVVALIVKITCHRAFSNLRKESLGLETYGGWVLDPSINGEVSVMCPQIVGSEVVLIQPRVHIERLKDDQFLLQQQRLLAFDHSKFVGTPKIRIAKVEWIIAVAGLLSHLHFDSQHVLHVDLHVNARILCPQPPIRLEPRNNVLP